MDVNPAREKEKFLRAARAMQAAHGPLAADVAERRGADLLRQGEAEIAAVWKEVATAIRALARATSP